MPLLSDGADDDDADTVPGASPAPLGWRECRHSTVACLSACSHTARPLAPPPPTGSSLAATEFLCGWHHRTAVGGASTGPHSMPPPPARAYLVLAETTPTPKIRLVLLEMYAKWLFGCNVSLLLTLHTAVTSSREGGRK